MTKKKTTYPKDHDAWPWCKACESYHSPKLATCFARKKMYYTIGVRFLYGPNFGKMYTYRVCNRNKVTLGQELVADTPSGSAVVVAVRIDTKRQDTNVAIEYKYITHKVAPL